MSKVKMDFSKYKLSKSNDKTTTLKHPDGHSITLVHGALSKDMQSALKSLPSEYADAADAHEAKAAKMSDGGDVKANMAGLQKGAAATQDQAAANAKSAKQYPSNGETVAHAVSTGQAAARQAHPEEAAKEEAGAAADKGQSTEDYNKEMNASMAGYAKGGEVNNPKLQQSHVCPHCNGGMAMADGGDVGQDGAPVQVVSNGQPLQVEPVAATDEQQPQPMPSNQPTKSMSFEGEETSTPPVDVKSETSVPDLQKNTQDAPPAPAMDEKAAAPQAPVAQDPIDANKAKYASEDAAWQHDLTNGHVEPETAASLFHDRGVLGKIGMIFGMMLSGVGSGLTGKDNAALSLMQKQIDNDLAAQGTSKTNAQNYMKLAQMQALNEANIANVNTMTQAQKQDIAIKAQTLAHNNAVRSAFHDLVQKGQALPAGPAKDQYMNGIAAMSPMVDQAIQNRSDQAAAMQAYIGLMSGGTNPGNLSEQQFQSTTNGLRASGNPIMKAKADDMEAKHIPGIKGQASAPLTSADKDKINAMNTLDAKAADLLDYIKHNTTVNGMPSSAKATGAQKMAELLTYYNQSTNNGGALTDSKLKWYDDQLKEHPTDVFAKLLGNTERLKEVKESNIQRRNQLLSGPGGLGFPPQDAGGAKPDTRVVGGITYKRNPSDGKLYPVK